MPVHVPVKKFTNRIQGDRADTFAKVWYITAKPTMHRATDKIPESVADEVMKGDNEK